jgi:hypothetical protein
MPRWCEPVPFASHPAPLVGGSHVLVRNEGLPLPGSQAAPRLPVSALQKIIEDDARSRSSRIEFFRSASGLLARGDAAALAAARARIAEIERATDALGIDLEIELVGSAAGQGKGDRPGGSGTASERYTAKTRADSRQEVFVGERRARPFVMSFDVEVAADSGIAAPVIGTAASGRTLHLSASRIDGGKRVHLEGLLDLSDLASLERFDPETPDLGTLQQPRIDIVQIAFAGVVESGGQLEVEIAGAALALPDWKLTVRAGARADDAAPADAVLDVLDLAFLASESTTLPSAGPGAELDRQAFFVQPRRTTIPIPPSAIAAALDVRSGDGGGPRSIPSWTDDLLILPRSDAVGRAEARGLVAAAEQARVATCRIEARRGALVARFPACSGSPARLLAGRERTALVGYRAEIAPQTWMPAPAVERSFDGLALTLEVQAGGAACSTWIAESTAEEIVARQDAQLGRIQILARGLRSERAILRAGEPERSLAGGRATANGSDDVRVRVQVP